MKQPGLLVPPLTPFTEELKVDEPSLKRQVDYIVAECAPQMVVAAGVEAQEYHYLSFEDRKNLVRRTVEFVDGRAPVAVGISHPSFGTAVELAHLAERLGAHAIQLLAPLRPFGGAPNEHDLLAYFSAVARETTLPIILYLNPGPGADVPLSTTIEIAKLERVRYVKESSRDLSRVGRLIVEIDQAGHARYYTTMQMLLASLELGGSGATMPPPAAELAKLVIAAFMRGDHAEAVRLQRQFAIFPNKWMHRGLTPTMKAAMQILGRPVGSMYPPFQGLSTDEVDALRDYLKTTDFLPASEGVHAAA